MSNLSTANLLVVSGGALAIAAAVMVAAAVVGWRTGRVRDVDTAWGLGFVLVAAWSAAAGDGSLPRRLVLVGLVGVWGLRLSWHVARRNRGSREEDPRYADLLADAPGNAFAAAARKVYAVQGAAVWFVSLPVQVSAAAGPGLWPLTAVGGLVWAVGLAFEAVGDTQLAAFKSDPHRGQVMDRGVWGWTRHPNYFGDACLWWGIYLVAASTWPGAATVLSPTVMTVLLVQVTGVRLLERRMSKRPGYPEYQARTSAFLPRPPRPERGG